MTTITFVRHGETDANRQNIIQGHADWPLNDEGRAQAERLSARVAKWQKRPTAIIASPLKRASETAAIIAKPLDLSLGHDERLMEMSFGDIDGLSRPEANEQYGSDYLDGFFHNRENPEAPAGGESPQGVLERISAAVAAIREAHDGQHVLVVSHGLVLRNYCHHLLDIPVGRPRFRFGNTAITTVKFAGDRIMFSALGDKAHLE